MTFAHPAWLLALPLVLLVVVLVEIRLAGRPRRRAARTVLRFALLALLIAALAGPYGAGFRPTPQRVVVAVDRSASLTEAGTRREALAEVDRAVAEAREAGAEVTFLGFATTAAPPHPGPRPEGPGAEGPGADGEGPGRADPRWPDVPPVAPGTPGTPGTPAAPVPSAAPGPPDAGGIPEPEGAGQVRFGDAATGLAAARLAFAPDEGGGILLLTSGRGDDVPTRLGLAAEGMAADGIGLRAVALPKAAPPSPVAPPRIQALDLPDRARGPFTARVQVTGAGPLEVVLQVDGAAVDRRSVPGTGPRSVVFADLAPSPGVHEVSLVVRQALAGDAEASDPALVRRVVRVDTPPTLLAVVADPYRSPARRAATAQGFVVESLEPESVGMALGGDASSPPDVILLDAASAVRIPEPMQEALIARVEEGLGLFLEAGDSEEAWTALTDHPLGRILPLRPVAPPPAPPPVEEPPLPATPQPPVEPPQEDASPGFRAEREPEEALPISLMLVLDRSGSMEGRKLAMAIEAARRAAGTLSAYDRVAVVTFADDSTLDVAPTPVRRMGNLGWRLAMLTADGNTDIYAALALAARVLEGEDAPIRHMILLTDGRQNAAEALFGPLVRRMARGGITLTAVGLGMRHDEVLLKKLVQFAPRGRYVPADTEADLPTILTRDTQRVAEARSREAQALARIPDPAREPPERPNSEEPPPPAPPPLEPPAPTPPPEGPPAATLALLHLLRPHEATRGVEEASLPAVGAPRPAEPAPLAALLLIRGETEGVLAARRVGLGRVLAFALPTDAEGLQAWDDLGRVLVQGLRSVRAPEGVFDRLPSPRLLRTPEGERLLVEAPVDDAVAAQPVRVSWSGREGERDLGAVLPGQEIALPETIAGSVASVRLTPVAGGAAAPPLTYIARGPAGTEGSPPAAGDREALALALGPQAVAPDAPLLPPGDRRRPAPKPLWPYFVALAAALLLFDAALHRRAEAQA